MENKIRKAQKSELDDIMEIYAYAKRFMEEHGNLEQWTGDEDMKRIKSMPQSGWSGEHPERVRVY